MAKAREQFGGFLQYLDTIFSAPSMSERERNLNRGAAKMLERDMRELMPLLQLYRNMGGPEMERMYEMPEETRWRSGVQET